MTKLYYRIGGMNPSLMVTHAEHTAHSEMCSLHLTHPCTWSLVLGAVGSYCTAPGEQWEWGVSSALLKGTTAGQEVNWDLSK